MSKLRWIASVGVLLFVAPIAAVAAKQLQTPMPATWREADWSSAHMAPDPTRNKEAIIQIYAARTGGWKGIVSDHCWIILKDKNGIAFDRYEVLGWGTAVRKNAYAADGHWYSNKPRIIADVRGPAAEAILGSIKQAIATYPYAGTGVYRLWPGPNSNSFVADIARRVKGLDPDLPATAIGKDFLVREYIFDSAPSHTGWQVSLYGIAGVLIAKKEGVELSIGGLVLGASLFERTLKLPAIGTIHY